MQNNNQNRIDLKKALQVGALWKRTNVRGDDYFTGTIDREKLIEALNRSQDAKIQIMILSQMQSQNPKSPTHKIVCSQIEYIKQAPEDAFGF
jgi:uncharacterized protein (DUF736 family)